LNTFVLACLRDARHLNFDDSLIGVIETSLCNGPIYFDGYPDLTISLTDKCILETLKINIKLHGYNMLPGSEIITIIHHVHYKATNSICPKSLVNLTKGETTMMKCITVIMEAGSRNAYLKSKLREERKRGRPAVREKEEREGEWW
ncbi:MP domain-containing protein, partial [Cephalotus follicularis]